MKQAITPSPAPRPAAEPAPVAPAEARFPSLNVALWVWLAGFGLLVAELLFQVVKTLVVYLWFHGAGR